MAIYVATNDPDAWGDSLPSKRFSRRSGPKGLDAYVDHERSQGRNYRIFRWEGKCWELVRDEWIPYRPETYS